MAMKATGGNEKWLKVLDCDIEIQKYHMSMILSLLMPFILTFASLGMAANEKNLKIFFIALSIILLFFMAAIVVSDSSKLKAMYQQRKSLILAKGS